MLSGTANSMQAIASGKCGITRQNRAPEGSKGGVRPLCARIDRFQV